MIFQEIINQYQNLIIDYTIANLSKSKNISFLIAGFFDTNFSQTSLIDLNSTINTYKIGIFDERKTLFLKHYYSKGFYFSKNDHQIKLGYAVSGTFSDSKVIQNNISKPLNTNQFTIGTKIAFIPQKLFFTEIGFKTKHSNNTIFIDNKEVNFIKTNRNIVFLSK